MSVEDETNLIEHLQKQTAPEYKTTEWYRFDTILRDAYWRRRMKQSKIDGTDLIATSKVY
jgi:hypothetical protein